VLSAPGLASLIFKSFHRRAKVKAPATGICRVLVPSNAHIQTVWAFAKKKKTNFVKIRLSLLEGNLISNI